MTNNNTKNGKTNLGFEQTDEFTYKKSYDPNSQQLPPPYYIESPYYSQPQAIIISGRLQPIDQVPSDYLIWSIINTIFFSLIFGLIALIFSIKTRNRIRENLLPEARSSSKNAFILNLMATIFGIFTWILGIILLSVYTTSPRYG
jgi:hypothetical protein